MVRMQVQLPEDLHERLRSLAAEREWSLAETLRRASELLLSVYPRRQQRPETEWQLPQADLGPLLAPEDKWAEILEDDMLERHLK